MRGNPEEQQVAAKYEPTFKEREALTSMVEARKTRLPAPKIKVTVNSKGVSEISVDHPNHKIGWNLFEQSFATTSHDFINGMLSQVCNAVSKGGTVAPKVVNFALSVVAGINPKDELETMLAAQMAVVHMATMDFAGRLIRAESLNQLNSHDRTLNKLARTFTSQMEALRKHRTGGKQEVTVHHVTVNEGGQAIVGNVQQTRGEGEG